MFIACFAVVMGLNILYFNRHRRIMTYLHRNHPHLYEQVRRKPDIGPLYSKTYNPSKALIALSKQSHTLNDPRLKTMLAEFVQFDRKFVLVSSMVIVIMLLVVLIVSLVLMG